MAADPYNQPITKPFNAARLSDRKIDELIGLCKGILADGVVDQSEAKFLQQWLESNKDVADHWPASALYRRINDMLADNILDRDEEKELLETLIQITGGPTINATIDSMSSSLPITRPEPNIAFKDSLFCLTGKFVTGSRRQCQGIIETRGGQAQSAPTKKTNYLIIGAVGSPDWIHSTHGRKIEKAVEYQQDGTGIYIVSEEHWAKYIA